MATIKMNPPVNRLIGNPPKVGIRPTIDGRRKGVREAAGRHDDGDGAQRS